MEMELTKQTPEKKLLLWIKIIPYVLNPIIHEVVV